MSIYKRLMKTPEAESAFNDYLIGNVTRAELLSEMFVVGAKVYSRICANHDNNKKEKDRQSPLKRHNDWNAVYLPTLRKNLNHSLANYDKIKIQLSAYSVFKKVKIVTQESK